MLHSVLDHDVVAGVTVGDGTVATVAVLTMRNSEDKIVNVRIRAADGRSLSVRLGAVAARRLHEALGFAIKDLPQPPADYVAFTSRAERDRDFYARRAHLASALPGSVPVSSR